MTRYNNSFINILSYSFIGVSILGLINDEENSVKLILDRSILENDTNNYLFK